MLFPSCSLSPFPVTGLCPRFLLGKSDSRLSLKHNPDQNGISDPKNPRKLGKPGRSPSWGRKCYFNEVILTLRPSEHPGLIPGDQSQKKTGRALDFVGCFLSVLGLLAFSASPPPMATKVQREFIPHQDGLGTRRFLSQEQRDCRAWPCSSSKCLPQESQQLRESSGVFLQL